MERLFFALWPDDVTRARIEAARLGAGMHDGRAIPTGNLHVTLVFLGALDRAQRLCTECAAAAIDARAFELVLDEVQWRRRAGMVWLAATQTPAALLDVVGALQQALVACGYRSERRAFTAHVTLARDVRRAPRGGAIVPIRWRANEFCLVRSEPTARGSAYTVERRWRLG